MCAVALSLIYVVNQRAAKQFRVLQEFYKSDWNKVFSVVENPIRFSKENIIKRKESVLYCQILDLIYILILYIYMKQITVMAVAQLFSKQTKKRKFFTKKLLFPISIE